MGSLAQVVQGARQADIHIGAEVGPRCKIPAGGRLPGGHGFEAQALQLGPIRLADWLRPPSRHSVLDLIRRERHDFWPGAEMCLPFAIQSGQVAVLSAQPGAELIQGNGGEVVIERVGGDGHRQFIADVVGQRVVGHVVAHAAAHLPFGPIEPRRIVQGVVTDESRGIACLRPVRDEPVPIGDLGVEFQAEPAVDDVLDVIRQAALQQRRRGSITVNHGGVDAHLLEALIKERELVRLPGSAVADPHDAVILVPGTQGGARLGRPKAGRGGDEQECAKEKCVRARRHVDHRIGNCSNFRLGQLRRITVRPAPAYFPKDGPLPLRSSSRTSTASMPAARMACIPRSVSS